MRRYRPTRAIINLNHITQNVKTILKTYPGYKYYFGVVKADCYGLCSTRVMQAILDGGCNFLAVSLAEEALEVRRAFPDTNILLFVPAPADALPILREKNIAVSVATLAQAKQAAAIEGLKVHVRLNGGSDLFGGPTTPEAFATLIETIRHSRAILEGIYMHNYDVEDKQATIKELETFHTLTKTIDLQKIPIVNLPNSLALAHYPREWFQEANACRIGNIIYGFENEDPHLLNCFTLQSTITQIVTLKKGQSIGYAKAFTAKQDGEKIGVVPIGYGDGFAKTNSNRDVYIRQKPYRIVAVTMDITLIKLDEDIQENDTVELIRDARHVDEIARQLGSIAEESICLLGKRVYREYVGKTT